MEGLPRPTLLRVEPDEVLPNIDAHGYLQGVYRGQIKPNGSRLRAAIAALPFERAKLSSVIVGRAGDLADRLMQAIAASDKVMNSQSRMKTIEHEPSPVVASPNDPPDHSAPFASDLKSRFRRL